LPSISNTTHALGLYLGGVFFMATLYSLNNPRRVCVQPECRSIYSILLHTFHRI